MAFYVTYVSKAYITCKHVCKHTAKETWEQRTMLKHKTEEILKCIIANSFNRCEIPYNTVRNLSSNAHTLTNTHYSTLEYQFLKTFLCKHKKKV